MLSYDFGETVDSGNTITRRFYGARELNSLRRIDGLHCLISSRCVMHDSFDRVFRLLCYATNSSTFAFVLPAILEAVSSQ